MLTSGMVPALFADDEKDQIIGQVCATNSLIHTYIHTAYTHVHTFVHKLKYVGYSNGSNSLAPDTSITVTMMYYTHMHTCSTYTYTYMYIQIFTLIS